MNETANAPQAGEPKFSAENRYYLAKISGWSGTLALACFIVFGVMALLSIAGLFKLFFDPSETARPLADRGAAVAMFGVGIAMDIVVIIGAAYLYRFAIYVKKALSKGNADCLTESFCLLMKHYRLITLSLLVFIAVLVFSPFFTWLIW